MSGDVDLRELAIERSGSAAQVRTRRHVLTRYVLPLGLVAGFLALVGWASRDLLFPPQPVTVVPVLSTTAEVQQEGTPLFNAAGWVEPRPTPTRVAALAPGVVEELLVVEDQPVAAGEPIAELVKDDAKLAYERAQADLELRRAELDEAQAALTAAETRYEQPVHLEAALGEAEAALAKVETQLRTLPFEIRGAEANFLARQKQHAAKVAAAGVVAGVDIDVAKGDMDAAAARLEELRDRAESLTKEKAALTQRRDALRTQLRLLADETKAKDEAAARVRAATARVKQAEVVVAEARLRQERMTVRSPIAGRVYQLVAEPGTTLAGSAAHMTGGDGSTVVTLYRPDKLQVRVDVRFEDLPKVALHQPVKIDNPALQSPIPGQVLYISSEADIQKNTLEVKVEVIDPPPVFKPEMLVDVTFLAPPQEEGASEPSQEMRLYVPQQLVQQGEGGAFVWVADQSAGVARKTNIETGRVGSNGLVEVARGLRVSSRIITSGSEELQDGDRIRVTNEDALLGSSNDNGSTGEASPRNRLPTGDNE